MADHLLRLAWALPVVLLVGLGALLLLKRWGVGTGLPIRNDASPQIVSSTALSENTQLIVIRLHGQEHMVFESARHIQVQAKCHAPTHNAIHTYGSRRSPRHI